MQIEILTSAGSSIQLVRFFDLTGKQFLIYLNNGEGADAQGHITIHISEVVNNGHYIASNVADADYESIKNVIKGIVNANKNNQPLPIQDLDYNVLDGIEINGERALKLMSNYADLLRGNQPVFEKSVVENIIMPTQEQGGFVSNEFISNETIANDANYNTNNSIENNSFNTFENVEMNQPVVEPNSFEQSFVQHSEPTQPMSEVPTIPTYDSVTMNNNGFESNVAESQNDYEKLYNEQVELVNSLQNELDNYKNKLESIKSIINN